MRLSISIAVVTATLLGQAALAAQPAQATGNAGSKQAQQDQFTLSVLCAKPPNDSIMELRDDLQKLDLALPNIPPDEAAYLAKESVSAIQGAGDKASTEDKQVAGSRFAALQGRRLYYAWQARKALADALTVQRAIYDPDHAPAVNPWTGEPSGGFGPSMYAHAIGREDADTINRMIGTITSLHVLSNTVQEFLLNEQYRSAAGQQSLLTTKQWSDSSIAAYGSMYHLSAALDCAYMQYGMKHRN